MKFHPLSRNHKTILLLLIFMASSLGNANFAIQNDNQNSTLQDTNTKNQLAQKYLNDPVKTSQNTKEPPQNPPADTNQNQSSSISSQDLESMSDYQISQLYGIQSLQAPTHENINPNSNPIVTSSNGNSKLSQSQFSQKRFFTGTGFNLDQYLFLASSPIAFDILFDLDPNGFSEASLALKVWDVDTAGSSSCGPEIDKVSLNGHLIGSLSGANGQWSTVSFDISPSIIKNGKNEVKVDIDASGTGCWAVEVDWGEIVVPYTDVGVATADIQFTESSNYVEVKSWINNYGTQDVSNVKVSAYDVNEVTGSVNFIDSTTISAIAKESRQSVSIQWNNPTKNHLVMIKVDPDDTIQEAYENNNRARKKWTDITVDRLTADYMWVFLISPLFEVDNKFTATVDSKYDVASVDFSLVEAGKTQAGTPKGDSDYEATFKMHKDLVEGWNTIKVTATDTHGQVSDPLEIKVYGVVIPGWLAAIISAWSSYQEVSNIMKKKFYGSPVSVQKDPSNHKVLYEIKLAYDDDAYIPVPVFPILEIGGQIAFWLKASLDSTGIAAVSGGGKLGVGLKLSITDLVKKVPKPIKSLLDLLGTDEIKRTLDFFIELSGSANFGEGGLTKFKLDLKIGSEDTRSATLSILNTGLSIKYFLGIYTIFHIYDTDLQNSAGGWKDRVEFEIKPEISIRASFALATLLGSAWELTIKNQLNLKFWQLRGSTGLYLKTTDYNVFVPDTTTEEVLDGPYTYDTSQTSISVDNLINPVTKSSNIVRSSLESTHVPEIASYSGSSAMTVWSEFKDGGTTPAGYNIYYSKYSGSSWSTANLISDSSFPDVRPVIGYDAQGHAIAVWIRYNDSSIVNATDPNSVADKTQLFWSKYSGSSWSTPAALTSSGIYKTDPRLSASSDGEQLLLSWIEDADGNRTTLSDQTIRSMIFTDNTQSWSSTMEVASDNVLSTPSGTISSDGQIAYISYTRDTDQNRFTVDDQEIVIATYNGISWTTSILTSNTNGDLSPSIVIPSVGNPHLVWISYPLITNSNFTLPVIMESQFDSSAWTTPTMIWQPEVVNGNYSYVPVSIRLMSDPSNNLWIAAHGFSADSVDIALLSYTNSMSTWGDDFSNLLNSGNNELSMSVSTPYSGNYIFSSVLKDTTEVPVGVPPQSTTSYPTSYSIDSNRYSTVTDLSISEEDITITGELGYGNLVTVSALVRNSGDLSVGAFNISLYEYYASSTYLLESYRLDQFQSGGVYQIQYDWNISTVDYLAVLVIVVDSVYEVSESSEINNDISIKGVAVDTALVPYSFYYDFKDDTFKFRLTSDATSNTDIYMNFYWKDPRFNDAAPFLNIAGTIYNGYEYTQGLVTYAHTNFVNQTNPVYLEIVPRNGAKEVDEIDNLLSTLVILSPDLWIDEKLLEVGYDASSGELTSKFNIYNSGRGTANNFSVSVYVNGSLVSNQTVSSLPVGNRQSVTFSWAGTPNSYEISVIVDSTNVVKDTMRSNNFLSKVYYVSPAIMQASSFSLSGLDNDTNGLNDLLQLNMDLTFAQAGTYTIEAILGLPSGDHLISTYTGSFTTTMAGVSIIFDASLFGRLGGDGNISLEELNVRNQLSMTPLLQLFEVYSSTAFVASAFEQSPVIIKGTISLNHGVKDSDGNYRTIAVQASIQVFDPGTYFVAAEITLTDGTIVIQDGKYYSFASATTTALFMELSAVKLQQIQDKGPFVLRHLIVFNATDDTVLAYYYEPSILIASSDQFTGQPIRFTGEFKEILTDNYDGDILYNSLEIKIGVEVGWSTTFAVNGKLTTSNGELIGWGSSTSNLVAGELLTYVTLTFDGQDIWSSLVDGPYVLTDVSIYPTDDTYQEVKLSDPYLTQNYAYQSFQTGAAVYGYVNKTSEVNGGDVMWYTGIPQFAETNQSGYYHMAFRYYGIKTLEIDNNIQFFIELNGQMVQRSNSYVIDIQVGDIIRIDFVEGYDVGDGYTFQSIQAAINNASDGSYVTVHPSVQPYKENVVVNRSLSILGLGASTPVLNATNLVGFNIVSSDVVLRGIEILSGNQGIYASGVSNIEIKDMRIMNSTLGISLVGVTNSRIFGNVFANNTANIADDGSNAWDSGAIGNYYDDYSGTDSDSDGIGDTGYSQNGATDNLPRMQEVDTQDIYVSATGNGDFDTIQAAINFATDYAQIRLVDGPIVDDVIVNKTVEIFSDDFNSRVNVTHSTGSTSDVVFEIYAANATLHHINVLGIIDTIVQNTTMHHLWINGTITASGSSSHLDIRDSYITNNSYQDLINLRYSDHVLIRNNTITMPYGGSGDGIYTYYVNNLEILDNRVIGDMDALLQIYQGVNVTVTGNVLDGYARSNGFMFSYLTNLQVRNNNVSNVYYGLYLYYSTTSSVESNNFVRGRYGFRVQSTPDTVLKSNTFKNFSDYLFYLTGTQNLNISLNSFLEYYDRGTIVTGTIIDWAQNGKGNYWDEYNGTDGNSDGIGDTPIEVYSSPFYEDQYPLMASPNIDLYDTIAPIAVSLGTIDILSGVTAYISAAGSTDNTGVVGYFWQIDGYSIVSPTSKELAILMTVPGPHTGNLTVYDLAGNNDTSVFTINVVDNTPPTFSLTASATQVLPMTQVDFEARYLQDAGGINNTSYHWYFSYQGALHEYTTLTFSFTFDVEGFYQVYFEVSDLAGITTTMGLLVSVVDTPPSFTYVASNGSKFGITETINLNLDNSNGSIVYHWDNGQNMTVLEVSGNYYINLSTSGLNDGWHQFMAYAWNTIGTTNAVWRWYYIDTVAPEIIIFSPGNNTFTLSTTLEIQYAVSGDLYQGSIYLDGTWLNSISKTGNQTITASSLATGNHVMEFTVRDYQENSMIVDLVFVVGIDNTGPSISSPPDLQFDEGSVNQTISWSVGDEHPGNYTVYRDASAVETGSWTNGSIRISVDGLTVGTYNFTLVVTDIVGNQASDEVDVTVSPIGTTTPPDTTSPSDTSQTSSSLTTTTSSTVSTDTSESSSGQKSSVSGGNSGLAVGLTIAALIALLGGGGVFYMRRRRG